MDQTIPITRCPQCQTTFRVRPAQLEAAGGKVRCGSCLQIFSAPENEVSIELAGPPAADEAAPPPEAPSSALPDDTPPIPTDDLEWGNQRDSAPDFPADNPTFPAGVTGNLHRGEQVDSERIPATESPGPTLEATPSKADPGVPTVRNRFEQARAHLDNLSSSYGQRNHRRRGLWRAASAVLALVLVLQGLWWGRSVLSELPLVGAVYPPVCALIDCGLASPEPTTDTLQTLSSSLRADGPDGLRLDAVVVNRGERPQPFPDIIVTLQSMQGDPIADGQFTPADYLGADRDASTQLMPGRPVSVTLPLNRPVESPENFTLQLTY